MPWPLGLVRALVLALLLPVASAGALPFWAEAVGVEGAHVCHCSVEKHDCVCARCHPDRDDQRLTEESLKGQCGDDERSFPGKALRAVELAAAFVLHAPLADRPSPVLPPAPEGAPASPPPTPPPRSTLG